MGELACGEDSCLQKGLGQLRMLSALCIPSACLGKARLESVNGAEEMVSKSAEEAVGVRQMGCNLADKIKAL